MRLGYTFLWACFAILLCQCASTPSHDTTARLSSPTPFRIDSIEPQAKADFVAAEELFKKQEFGAALDQYRKIKARFPKGQAHLLSSYREGSIYYYQQDYPRASREFEYFLNRFPDSDLAFDVKYNLAASEFQLQHYDKAFKILSSMKEGEVQKQEPRRAVLVYELKGQSATAIGNTREAVLAYATQMQLPLTESKRDAVGLEVDQLLDKLSQEELQNIYSIVTETSTRAKITKRLSGTPRNHSALSEPTQPGFMAFPEAVPSGAASTELSRSSSGEAYRVGVVLPLTGRWASYGKRALDGIMLATQIYHPSGQSPLRVFVEDTASNPVTAGQAVEKLVERDRVVAIVGPLNWRESVVVAEKAQQYGVLNLSLSTKEGISDKGPYLFQNALTPSVQFENLVYYCVAKKGMKRFGILAAKSEFGRDMANTFWDMVEKYGGRVVAYETYEPEDTDFQTQIRSMFGLENPAKYRKLEYAKMQEYIKEQNLKGSKAAKVKLPPIVMMDALFVPDNPKVVASVAATLPYYKVKNLALLGTTEWNTEQLYRRGGKFVEGAIFPGGVNPATSNRKQQAFIRSFVEAYGMQPDLISGQAYEAMDLVRVAVEQTASPDRNRVVQYLSSLTDYDTLLGTLSFDQTRIARRKIPVYMLEYGGNVVEIPF